MRFPVLSFRLHAVFKDVSPRKYNLLDGVTVSRAPIGNCSRIYRNYVQRGGFGPCKINYATVGRGSFCEKSLLRQNCKDCQKWLPLIPQIVALLEINVLPRNWRAGRSLKDGHVYYCVWLRLHVAVAAILMTAVIMALCAETGLVLSVP